jgi:hypothetical protein
VRGRQLERIGVTFPEHPPGIPCKLPDVPCSVQKASLFASGNLPATPRNPLTLIGESASTAAPEKKFPASREFAIGTHRRAGGQQEDIDQE